jgi:hypothetical protein
LTVSTQAAAAPGTVMAWGLKGGMEAPVTLHWFRRCSMVSADGVLWGGDTSYFSKFLYIPSIFTLPSRSVKTLYSARFCVIKQTKGITTNTGRSGFWNRKQCYFSFFLIKCFIITTSNIDCSGFIFKRWLWVVK